MVPIARCASGCHPPMVEIGIGNSFGAGAEAWRTLQNLLIFSSHAFFSRVNGFSNPSRIRAGESWWQMVISNISAPPWLPNELVSGRSLCEPKRPRFEYWMPRRLLEVGLKKPNLRCESAVQAASGSACDEQCSLSHVWPNVWYLRRSASNKKHGTVVFYNHSLYQIYYWVKEYASFVKNNAECLMSWFISGVW